MRKQPAGKRIVTASVISDDLCATDFVAEFIAETQFQRFALRNINLNVYLIPRRVWKYAQVDFIRRRRALRLGKLIALTLEASHELRRRIRLNHVKRCDAREDFSVVRIIEFFQVLAIDLDCV